MQAEIEKETIRLLKILKAIKENSNKGTEREAAKFSIAIKFKLMQLLNLNYFSADSKINSLSNKYEI